MDDVAKTIYQQLGGGRFKMMTGAKNFVRLSDGDGGIGFTIPMHNKIRGVRIMLNGMDLYDVEFLDRNFSVFKKVADVYNDQLPEIFTEYTGLYTHL